MAEGDMEQEHVVNLVVPCRVFSRIVGYYAATEDWGPGKLAEWGERVPYTPILRTDGRERRRGVQLE